MAAGIWFWIIFVLCFVFAGWSFYGGWQYGPQAGGLVVFILLGLLGWKCFGPPIQ